MAVTFNIQVGLDVFKALTAKLEEGQTHDDVIRELLGMDSIVELEAPNPFERFEQASDGIRRGLAEATGGGFYSRNLWLPNGTRLRARYKQRLYEAVIKDNRWIDHNGQEHSSPSAAASAVTETNVNGLRFWEAMRPTDTGWRRLDALIASKA